ncbi:MAG: hypothetical protein LBU70_02615 [Chitinispirillales bacterium]|jgi:hypothetical protein|nr:hypothetical protein [Chitinispirillales bacterium]
MKTRVKMLVAAVLVGGVVWGAGAQPAREINLNTGGAYLNLVSHPPSPASNAEIASYVSTVRGYAAVVLSPHQFETVNYRDFHVINGTIHATNLKSFIHPHPTDESKVIRYTAIESGEVLTVARGVARTENGQAIIELPPHFSMVTSEEAPISVIVTPKGAPVLLYVKEESREKIVIAMREPDFIEFKDVEFSYQVTGVRDGFEKIEVVVDEGKLNTRGSVRSDIQERIDAYEKRVDARIERWREGK